MRCRTLVIAAMFALTATPRPCNAVDERFQAFDGAGIFRLDAPQRNALHLWPGAYPRFEEARLLRDELGTYQLQVIWRDHGARVQTRVELSPAEVESLRAAVRDLPESLRDGALSSSARTWLLAGTSFAGLGLYSWGVPVASNAEGKQAVAVGMLVAGSSFVVPALLTRREQVTPGMTLLSTAGLYRGIGYGNLIDRLWRGPRRTTEEAVASSVVGSVTCGAAGYLWARHARLDAGRAHLIEVGSDLGTLAGVEAAIAFNLDSDAGEHDRGLEYASTLAGAALGTTAGWLRGRSTHASWGSAELARTASIVTQGIAMCVWDAGTDNASTIAGAGLAGSLAGAYLGNWLLSNPTSRTNDAVLVDLYTVAGAALGVGAAYLMRDDTDASERERYLIGGTAGATTGLILGAVTLVGRSVGESSDRAVDVTVTPLVSLAHDTRTPITGLTLSASF